MIKKIELILNIIGVATTIAACGLLITKIWIDKGWIAKALLSDLTLFATVMILYRFICYEEDE